MGLVGRQGDCDEQEDRAEPYRGTATGVGSAVAGESGDQQHQSGPGEDLEGDAFGEHPPDLGIGEHRPRRVLVLPDAEGPGMAAGSCVPTHDGNQNGNAPDPVATPFQAAEPPMATNDQVDGREEEKGVRNLYEEHERAEHCAERSIRCLVVLQPAFQVEQESAREQERRPVGLGCAGEEDG